MSKNGCSFQEIKTQQHVGPKQFEVMYWTDPFVLLTGHPIQVRMSDQTRTACDPWRMEHNVECDSTFSDNGIIPTIMET